MKKKGGKKTAASDWATYYDHCNILNEFTDSDPELSLDQKLRTAILEGKRKHRLQSVTLKLDPVQVQAIKKLATMKSIPYQTLIRHWLAEDLKKELHLATV